MVMSALLLQHCFSGPVHKISLLHASASSEVSGDLNVIDKGFFSEAFLFKPRGGHSPPSGLNRKPRKNPLFSL